MFVYLYIQHSLTSICYILNLLYRCKPLRSRFVFLSFNVIQNIHIIMYVKYVDCAGFFSATFIHLRQFFLFFFLSICKSNIPLTSVIMNLK
jgi:hypothetical protein